MPGLSIYYTKNSRDNEQLKRIDSANTLMRIRDDYTTKRIIINHTITVDFTAYPQYPRSVIDSSEYLILIEGCIYNKQVNITEYELTEIASKFFTQDSNLAEKKITDWVLNTHGDFLILLLEKQTGDFVLFNDCLGHLPLFYFQSDEYLLISREPKFIISALNHKQSDTMGIAEYLLFTYNLKHRSTIKGIHRLQPVSMIAYKDNSPALKTLYEWEFGKSQDDSIKVSEYGKEFAGLFQESIRNCSSALSDHYPIVALSGGLDSRAIYFGLSNSGVKFSSYTSSNSAKSNQPDIDVAHQIADKVPADWRLYEFGSITLDDYKEVAYNQEIGSSIIMALACEGYRLLNNDFGHQISFYTGDGGNQILHPITTDRKFANLDELTEYMINTSRVFAVEDICDLTGIKKDDIYQNVFDVFDSYPETDLKWKYAHFRTFGRAFRFVMEGEDRSRFHYWLVAPLWNQSLLKVSMSIPESYKQSLILYREFFRHLDKRTLDFKYANTGYKLDSPLSFLYGKLKSLAKSQQWLFHFAKRVMLRNNFAPFNDPVLDGYMDNVITSSNTLGDHINLNCLERLTSQKLNRIQYYLIYSIILRYSLVENDFTFV